VWSTQNDQSIFTPKYSVLVSVEGCILENRFVFEKSFYVTIKAISSIQTIEATAG
jgi:hypothetical protein